MRDIDCYYDKTTHTFYSVIAVGRLYMHDVCSICLHMHNMVQASVRVAGNSAWRAHRLHRR